MVLKSRMNNVRAFLICFPQCHYCWYRYHFVVIWGWLLLWVPACTLECHVNHNTDKKGFFFQNVLTTELFPVVYNQSSVNARRTGTSCCFHSAHACYHSYTDATPPTYAAGAPSSVSFIPYSLIPHGAAGWNTVEFGVFLLPISVSPFAGKDEENASHQHYYNTLRLMNRHFVSFCFS